MRISDWCSDVCSSDLPGEVEMLDILAFERLAGVTEIDFGALRPGRCDRRDLVNRELAFGENGQHLAAHISGGTNDDDLVAHDLTLHSMHNCGVGTIAALRRLSSAKRFIGPKRGFLSPSCRSVLLRKQEPSSTVELGS